MSLPEASRDWGLDASGQYLGWRLKPRLSGLWPQNPPARVGNCPSLACGAYRPPHCSAIHVTDEAGFPLSHEERGTGGEVYGFAVAVAVAAGAVELGVPLLGVAVPGVCTVIVIVSILSCGVIFFTTSMPDVTLPKVT